MKVFVLLLLILLPYHGAAGNINHCDTELKVLKEFASRESDQIRRRLSRVQPEIERLPRREKIRARVLMVEAESSRVELDRILDQSSTLQLPCPQISEDIRARLFHVQEFAFNILFKYDDRIQTASTH
jgi:hypothetical protein